MRKRRSQLVKINLNPLTEGDENSIRELIRLGYPVNKVANIFLTTPLEVNRIKAAKSL